MISINEFNTLDKYMKKNDIINDDNIHFHINLIYNIYTHNLFKDEELKLIIEKLYNNYIYYNNSNRDYNILLGFVFDKECSNLYYKIKYPYYLYNLRNLRIELEKSDISKIYDISNNAQYPRIDILYSRYRNLLIKYNNDLSNITEYDKILLYSTKEYEFDPQIQYDDNYISYPYYLLKYRSERQKLKQSDPNKIYSLLPLSGIIRYNNTKIIKKDGEYIEYMNRSW